MIRIMPRPDGTLYQSEKDAIAKAEKARAAQLEPAGIAVAAKRRGRPPGKKVEAVPAVAVVAKPERKSVVESTRRKILVPPEAVERIIESIRVGLSIERAALREGIPGDSIRHRMGKDPVLRNRIRGAEVDFEKGLACKMHDFAQTDQKAAAWLLERRCGWVPPAQRLEASGTVHHLTIHKSLLGGIGKLNEPPPIEVQARKVS
jgi:hypothetical protein